MRRADGRSDGEINVRYLGNVRYFSCRKGPTYLFRASFVECECDLPTYSSRRTGHNRPPTRQGAADLEARERSLEERRHAEAVGRGVEIVGRS